MSLMSFQALTWSNCFEAIFIPVYMLLLMFTTRCLIVWSRMSKHLLGIKRTLTFFHSLQFLDVNTVPTECNDFCNLFCRPTLWEAESPLWSKSMQKWRSMCREPRWLSLSLPRRIQGPFVRLQIWLGLHVIRMSGGTNLRCRGACEDLISLICFISHKQEMAYEN